MAAKGGGLLVLLALGAGLVMLGGGGGSKAQAATAANGLPPGTGKYDSPGGPVMPMTMEKSVDSELASDTSTANLQELSDSLSPMWPKAVTLLNAKIAALKAMANPPAPSPAPAPVPIIAPAPVVSAPVLVTPAPVVIPPLPVPVPIPAPVAAPAPVTPAAPTYPAWASTGIGNSGISIAGIAPGLPAIPGNYAAQSDETTSVQQAINAWGNQVGLVDPDFPLTTDGLYGPHTQGAVGLFQNYVNETQGAGLTVDGLAGPLTQESLITFGDIAGGGNY